MRTESENTVVKSDCVLTFGSQLWEGGGLRVVQRSAVALIGSAHWSKGAHIMIDAVSN